MRKSYITLFFSIIDLKLFLILGTPANRLQENYVVFLVLIVGIDLIKPVYFGKILISEI